MKRKCAILSILAWTTGVYGQGISSGTSNNCTNLDFESSAATATITGASQISGWQASGGSAGAPPAYNPCNLGFCCPGSPSASVIYKAPGGIIDPVIGDCYPIYSVFGSSPAALHAKVVNPQINFEMKGNNFLRINSSNAKKGLEKFSTSINVTHSNAVFRFAYIAVLPTKHSCCDGGSVRMWIGSGSSCPDFSVTALSVNCTNNSSTEFLIPGTCNAASANPDYNFNKWKVVSFDLTAYIGQVVNLNVAATSCTDGNHFGYCYFDAECTPVNISGNNIVYSAFTTSVQIPVCKSGGDLICAPSGFGPYYWSGPALPPGYSVPSMTNQCFTGSSAGNYTLYMNPPGSCGPIQRLIVRQEVTGEKPELTAPPYIYDLCNLDNAQISPYTNGDLPGVQFSWQYPPGATVSGANTPTLTTNKPGIYTVTATNPSNGCKSVLLLPLENCVGLEKPSSHTLDFNLFPVPFDEELRPAQSEHNSTITYRVYNSVGKVQLTGKLDDSHRSIPTADLAPGVYFIEFRSGEWVAVKKAVKVKFH